RRVVVETTGLADPAPILATLLSEPVVRHHYEPERVIATVDALLGLREEESLRQAIAADRLVVTKTDVADAGELERELRRLNPTAEILAISFGRAEPEQLFGGPERYVREVEPASHAHHDVRAFSLLFDEPLDWTAFGVWLTMLLEARGRDV